MGKTLWGASPLGIAVNWLEKELFGVRQSAKAAPVPVAPILNALSISVSAFDYGTPASFTIDGATAGTVITASGLPDGITIDSTTRAGEWDGAGAPIVGTFILIETPSYGASKSTVIAFSISVIPTLGGTGTLSAPILSFPTADNPPTVPVKVPDDWSSGDKIELAYSTNENMAGSSILSYTLQDTDTPGSTVSIGIPTLSGIHYFQAFGSHSGTGSQYLSNKVGWGDSSDPVITASPTQNPNELTRFSIPVPANKTLSSVAITGGQDRSFFEPNGLSIRPFDNGTLDVTYPTDIDANSIYLVDVTATDLFGNTSVISFTITPVSVNKRATAPSFPTTTNATVGQDYQSIDYQVAGSPALTAGIILPASATVPYSLDFGATWNAAGSFTVSPGDFVRLKVTCQTGGRSGALTIGTGSYAVTGTFSVADNSVTKWRLYVTLNGSYGPYSTSIAELEFRATVGGAALTGGTVISSGYNTYPATGAFDANTATQWLSNQPTSAGVWAGKDFGTNTPTVAQIAITSDGANYALSPTVFKLQKYIGGVWTDVQSWTTPNNWTAHETRLFTV